MTHPSSATPSDSPKEPDLRGGSRVSSSMLDSSPIQGDHQEEPSPPEVVPGRAKIERILAENEQVDLPAHGHAVRKQENEETGQALPEGPTLRDASWIADQYEANLVSIDTKLLPDHFYKRIEARGLIAYSRAIPFGSSVEKLIESGYKLLAFVGVPGKEGHELRTIGFLSWIFGLQDGTYLELGIDENETFFPTLSELEEGVGKYYV